MQNAGDYKGLLVMVTGGLDPRLHRANRVADHDHMLESMSVHGTSTHRGYAVVQRYRPSVQVELRTGRARAYAVPNAVDIERRVPGRGCGVYIGIITAPIWEIPVEMVIGSAVHEQLHRRRLGRAAVTQFAPQGLIDWPKIRDTNLNCMRGSGQRGQRGDLRAGRRRSGQHPKHGQR